jgi:hypothetical protein
MPIEVDTHHDAIGFVSVLLHGDVAEDKIPNAIIMVGHPQ